MDGLFRAAAAFPDEARSEKAIHSWVRSHLTSPGREPQIRRFRDADRTIWVVFVDIGSGLFVNQIFLIEQGPYFISEKDRGQYFNLRLALIKSTSVPIDARLDPKTRRVVVFSQDRATGKPTSVFEYGLST